MGKYEEGLRAGHWRLVDSGVTDPGYRVGAGGGGERCCWSMGEGGVKTIAERE
jgi:hypothetical protein